MWEGERIFNDEYRMFNDEGRGERRGGRQKRVRRVLPACGEKNGSL